MKQICAFQINLAKIKGNGDFLCPQCGTIISPDDETEETYSIVYAKANTHGLEEVIIRCNKCGSQIHLTGFLILQKLTLEKEEKEAFCYFDHL